MKHFENNDTLHGFMKACGCSAQQCWPSAAPWANRSDPSAPRSVETPLAADTRPGKNSLHKLFLWNCPCVALVAPYCHFQLPTWDALRSALICEHGLAAHPGSASKTFEWMKRGKNKLLSQNKTNTEWESYSVCKTLFLQFKKKVFL